MALDGMDGMDSICNASKSQHSGLGERSLPLLCPSFTVAISSSFFLLLLLLLLLLVLPLQLLVQWLAVPNLHRAMRNTAGHRQFFSQAAAIDRPGDRLTGWLTVPR